MELITDCAVRGGAAQMPNFAKGVSYSKCLSKGIGSATEGTRF